MLHRRLPRMVLRCRAYYLTCCVDGRRPLLGGAQLAESLLKLYAARRDRGAIALHGYVVMPDHYHVLLTLGGESSVSGVVRAVHSLFARTCRGETRLQGRIWQRRFYDHVIRDEADLRAKLSYLHANPLRAGVVEEPASYARSSCRFWETGRGPVSCDAWD
jgi:putative transposase